MSAITCQFWNVGQGLFSSGKILSDTNEFVWVYDCGSMNQQHITAAVKNMKETYQNEVIDLLAISHFDKDHISGLTELLKEKKVKRWLLPYYPLWHRLEIALSLGLALDSEEFRFYLNPAKFMIEQYADYFEENGELLFVPPLKAGEEIHFPEYQEEQPFSYQNDEEFKKELADIPSGKFLNHNISIKLLDPRQSAIFNDIEFVPYNMPLEDLSKKPTDICDFQKQVKDIIDCPQTVEEKIASLKQFYDGNFGANSKPRNKISLFLYIGKVSRYENALLRGGKFEGIPNLTRDLEHKHDITYACNCSNQDDYLLDCCGICRNPKRAILYTGDGYLDTPNKFATLQTALGSSRIPHILVFQVPHHGSQNNSYIGLAEFIQPICSIFSARGSKNHHTIVFGRSLDHATLS